MLDLGHSDCMVDVADPGTQIGNVEFRVFSAGMLGQRRLLPLLQKAGAKQVDSICVCFVSGACDLWSSYLVLVVLAFYCRK